MGKERLVEILNDLVAVEISAVTEYQQHAYLSENPRIVDLMEDFSMDEMSHIEWCSREVARLGGTPTVVPKEVRHAEKEYENLIKRDLSVEAEAIDRLTQYIKVAEEEGDQRIKKTLQEIYADEQTHHSVLNNLLNPPKGFLSRVRAFADIGTGMILTGIFWLYFWGFHWWFFYLADPRWAHNFSFPLILISIGVAYKGGKMSTDLLATVSSLMIIPTETGLISGIQSTYITLVLLAIMLLLLLAETGRKKEILFLQHRWRRWFKKHLLIISYLFLMHMTFIFFFVRVFLGDAMQANLPPEPPWEPEHWSTSSYNLLVIPFGLIGMAERFRGTLRRRIRASNIGYWLSLAMVIIGIIIVSITSHSWLKYSPPLIVAVAILTASIIAHKK